MEELSTNQKQLPDTYMGTALSGLRSMKLRFMREVAYPGSLGWAWKDRLEEKGHRARRVVWGRCRRWRERTRQGPTHWKTQARDSPPELPDGGPANTLASHLWPLELWKDKCLLCILLNTPGSQQRMPLCSDGMHCDLTPSLTHEVCITFLTSSSKSCSCSHPLQVGS